VRAALPSPALAPREAAPGRVAVAVTAYDHRRSDLAPYRELGVWIPVAYRAGGGGVEVPGHYCYALPVTTEEARAAGVEGWGFPKYVAEIELVEGATGCRCRVHADGREILALEVGGVPVAAEPERVELPAFTATGDELLLSTIVSEGRRGQRADGEGARLVLGDHPRAEALRRLDLGPAVGQSRSTHLKAMLPAAERRFPLRPSPA
jgi:hypothetical protein